MSKKKKKKQKGSGDEAAVGENDMADNPLHDGEDDEEGDTENPLHQSNEGMEEEEDEEL